MENSLPGDVERTLVELKFGALMPADAGYCMGHAAAPIFRFSSAH
jgi:hypothetical protein